MTDAFDPNNQDHQKIKVGVERIIFDDLLIAQICCSFLVNLDG